MIASILIVAVGIILLQLAVFILIIIRKSAIIAAIGITVRHNFNGALVVVSAVVAACVIAESVVLLLCAIITVVVALIVTSRVLETIIIQNVAIVIIRAFTSPVLVANVTIGFIAGDIAHLFRAVAIKTGDVLVNNVIQDVTHGCIFDISVHFSDKLLGSSVKL